jgi:hypothetical protein
MIFYALVTKEKFCLSMNDASVISFISQGRLNSFHLNRALRYFSLESHCKAGAPALLFSLFTLSGCSLSPAIPVLGAAFPGWFFCLLGAALLLIPCHILIVRKGWQSRFSPLVFSYLALMFLFATILWFLFFVN